MAVTPRRSMPRSGSHLVLRAVTVRGTIVEEQPHCVCGTQIGCTSDQTVQQRNQRSGISMAKRIEHHFSYFVALEAQSKRRRNTPLDGSLCTESGFPGLQILAGYCGYRLRVEPL